MGAGRYRQIADDELIDELTNLARELRSVRICHINSTGYGGGVAELLSRLVPLANALGVRTAWKVIEGTPEFFTVTKALHNALQGAVQPLSESEKAIYLRASRQSARRLDTAYDVIFVHDPQPAALRGLAGTNRAKWIWRCHIDTSAPNPAAAEFLLPHVAGYDAVVFTLREFLLPGIPVERAVFIPPAIDPFAMKNMELPPDLCDAVVADAGIDVRRPLVLQVSRFDPWKDPMGVIRAYRIAKRAAPGLQLALVGALAGDDPEGWELLALVQREVAKDPDVHVLTNLGGVGNLEVNAFQRASDVIVQRSLREGFGLVVSEAFFKRKPVVGTHAGGIPMQFPAGWDRYLVSSVEQAAERIAELVHEPALREAFGAAAREHVRRKFLLPRLLRDQLRLVKSLLNRTG
jgi:trehalose synthase